MTNGPASELSQQDKDILEFEKQRWRYRGTKEHAILDQFAMSPTRYYQRLNALLDHPAAYVYAPVLVARLRRLREARATARSARRSGFSPS